MLIELFIYSVHIYGQHFVLNSHYRYLFLEARRLGTFCLDQIFHLKITLDQLIQPSFSHLFLIAERFDFMHKLFFFGFVKRCHLVDVVVELSL
jgi:hypothetical protein